MSETALTVRNEAPVEESLLSVILRVANGPNGANVEVMERLLGMKERIDDQERRTAFAAAMSRLQAKLPQINRTGKIMVSGQERSRYAKLEDLDAQIRPYLAEEGFAFSYDTAQGQGGEILFIGKLSHCGGHFELKQISMPIDNGGAKSKVQERGSTLSYAVRQLLRMHLNLVMRDEDNDGQGNLEKIGQSDSDTIRDLIDSTKSDKTRFLSFMGVAKVEDILKRDSQKAFNALRTKQRQG